MWPADLARGSATQPSPEWTPADVLVIIPYTANQGPAARGNKLQNPSREGVWIVKVKDSVAKWQIATLF